MMITRRGFLAGAVAAAGPLQARAADPQREITLDVVEGSLPFRPNAPPTPVLRYAPAPVDGTLRIRQGQDTLIRVRNHSTRPTSFQLCGLRGLGRFDDGRAAPTIPAGGETTVRFAPADSGTAWFRPDITTNDGAAEGLAGVLIVDPATEAPPIDGDIVLLLRDWRLDTTGRIAAAGQAGSTVLTIGDKPVPSDLSARPGARLRLRLVNASTDRVMVVACEGAKPFIVAVDGQPSDLFEPIRGTIPIGPGARFDLMADLPRTEGQNLRFTLKGTEQAETGGLEPDRLLATITARGEAVPPRPPIAALPANPALPAEIRLEASKRAELVIDQIGPDWRVNGVSGRGDIGQPVLRVRQGDVVTLGFVNTSRSLVPLTLAGQCVRLLHPKDDGWEPYWRDSVLLPPGSRNHVAFVAMAPGRWPIVSGFATQAMAGLRCWFEVAPGARR